MFVFFYSAKEASSGVISRIWIISVTVNLDYTNLGYKIYTTMLMNHIQKTTDAIFGENQSVATKNRTLLHTFSTIPDVIAVPYKLNLALIYLKFCELFTG